MYQVKSFYYQSIHGIRPFRFSMSKEKSFFYYEHNKSTCLSSLAAKLEVEDLYRIIEQVLLTIKTCDEYLLYAENFCLSPDMIQCQWQDHHLDVQLLYLPYRQGCHKEYRNYLILFVGFLSKEFNRLEHMEGFYYFVQYLEELKENTTKYSFVDHINIFFDSRQSGNTEKSVLI